MEQFWEILIEHIYEITVGIGVILCTVFNKPKTAEKLEKLKEKKIRKLERKGQKAVETVRITAEELEKLKGESK